MRTLGALCPLSCVSLVMFRAVGVKALERLSGQRKMDKDNACMFLTFTVYVASYTIS